MSALVAGLCALAVDVCSRCHRPAQTNDEGWCADCWQPDEVHEVLIDAAGDLAIGMLDDGEALGQVRGILGRELTALERLELLENVAEGLQQVEACLRD